MDIGSYAFGDCAIIFGLFSHCPDSGIPCLLRTGISGDPRHSDSPRSRLSSCPLNPCSSRILEGALEALRENGFIDGQNIALRQYNAEGDMATLNAIARQVTDGQFDMVMTFSTPAMQAVAKANTKGKAIHVFGLVADPFAAGVGLRRDAPLDHPRHLVGTGIPFLWTNLFSSHVKCFRASKRWVWPGIPQSPIP